jgi:hypothetical protein
MVRLAETVENMNKLKEWLHLLHAWWHDDDKDDFAFGLYLDARKRRR